MREKLFDSEAKVMEIIWARGAISAKEISLIAADTIGWNKNTTYTVIKNLKRKVLFAVTNPDSSALRRLLGRKCKKGRRYHCSTRFSAVRAKHCFQLCWRMKSLRRAKQTNFDD